MKVSIYIITINNKYKGQKMEIQNKDNSIDDENIEGHGFEELRRILIYPYDKK